MSRLIVLFVSFALALTSQAFALARGQAAGLSEAVICTGGGFLTVAVDAQGNPVAPNHICPDAVLSFGATGSLPPVPALPTAVTEVDVRYVSTGIPLIYLSFHPQARAPPVSS